MKDEECQKLSRVQDQLNIEVEELTAKLFEVSREVNSTQLPVNRNALESVSDNCVKFVMKCVSKLAPGVVIGYGVVI